jgi:hypothetical protein
MPAVQLARLNQQIDALIWQFTRPDDFLSRLRDLFELYSDRLYRAGHAVPPTSMTPAYHVPTLVLRHLRVGLHQPCRQHPAAALALVDALWAETMLEFRLLAAALLGYIPLTQVEPILERLRLFARPTEDNQVLETLLTDGGISLRREQPQQWIDCITRWNDEPILSVQSVGLKAIKVTAQDEQFTNLPPLFRILSEQLQTGASPLQVELQETLLALLRRSPTETVYLLRQILPLTTSSITLRLVRLILPRVPAEFQPGLRQALLQRNGRP